jgi:protein-S-isoprenylcysteine O-methyltransferase
MDRARSGTLRDIRCGTPTIMPWIHPQYFFMLLGASEIALALFKRSGPSAKSKDRGSFALLWIVIGAAIYGAIDIAHRMPRFHFELSNAAYLLAVVLFLGGMALRWWSIIHLGRFFTVNVAIAQDHRVVDDGPYKLLRHPSYTGALLNFCGGGLMLGNWLSILVLVLPVLTMFLWRIHIEERALRNALGGNYIAYMARTKRLVPFVY